MDPCYGYGSVFGYGAGYGTYHDGWRLNCCSPFYSTCYGSCGGNGPFGTGVVGSSLYGTNLYAGLYGNGEYGPAYSGYIV